MLLTSQLRTRRRCICAVHMQYPLHSWLSELVACMFVAYSFWVVLTFSECSSELHGRLERFSWRYAALLQRQPRLLERRIQTRAAGVFHEHQCMGRHTSQPAAWPPSMLQPLRPTHCHSSGHCCAFAGAAHMFSFSTHSPVIFFHSCVVSLQCWYAKLSLFNAKLR